MMMMGYGQFVFTLQQLAYQELERSNSWRHPSNARIGQAPASQYLGAGTETINLRGDLFPMLAGSPNNLDLLRQMAETGQAWPLVSGEGKVFGAYVLVDLREHQTDHLPNGQARRINFSLQLQRVDDGSTDQLGTQSNGAT